MSTTVFIAVITAALLHATWNALVKNGEDKHLAMAAVDFGHAPLAALALSLVPSPAPESYPHIGAGITLHFGYQIFLLFAYRAGDLTQVYPIARGVAPLLVAAISVLLLGVHLNQAELVAVLIIGLGVMSLSLVRRQDGMCNLKVGTLALLTGCFIAAYSLVDGTGARLAGTAVGFYGWLAIGNAIVFAAFTAISRPGVLRSVATSGRPVFFIGGSASFLAYALVTWAFTQAPIALVTALRETSIIFALGSV